MSSRIVDAGKLPTGKREQTARRIGRLLDELEPTGERLGSAESLRDARALLAAGGGASAQGAVASEHGLVGLVQWLADRFDSDP